MNPAPSVKTLSQIHDAGHKRMREILKTRCINLTDLPECEGFNAQSFWEYRMHALNTAARAFGVERYRSVCGRYWFACLNTGDVYNPTVIYFGGRYRVQSVGDFIEVMERRGVRFP